MSYLNTPNLVFTGDFQADTATVNNDVRHYDNSNFVKPNYQEPTDPNKPNVLDGWWNPAGGATFNFQNCTVQQISFPNGNVQRVAGGVDPVLGMLVGGPEGRATGKMVDMDPQWQMSSQLWCVRLRIYSATNELLLSGDIAVSGFRDLQMRQTDGGAANGQPMGGGWTSVLTNVVWGEMANTSPFLMALKNAAYNNMLSIQLNMYGFYYAHNDGRFSMGKMIGVIGPWLESEPLTFAPNRRLYGVMDWGGGNTYLGYSNFLVDANNKRVTLDLGGSFPIADSMGTISDNTQYTVGLLNGTSDFVPGSTTGVAYLKPTDFESLGTVNYISGSAAWLNTTGGMVSFNNLTDSQMALLSNHQLVIVAPSTTNPGQFAMVCRESVGGYNFRADNQNLRVECNESVDVGMYAYQWGVPLTASNFTYAIQQPTQANFGGNTGPGNPTAPFPYINCPANGLTLVDAGPVGSPGQSKLIFTGNKIINPRIYIDGQMYYINYFLNGNQNPDGAIYGYDNIFVNLRSYYEVPVNPTWDDISYVMTQFGNIYPLMSKFIVDLGSEQSVLSKKDILIYAFTRDINDPLYMPATRDLSESMRQTIVKWLNNPLPGTGTPTPRPSDTSCPSVAPPPTAKTAAAASPKDELMTKGKSGAMKFVALASDPFDNI